MKKTFRTFPPILQDCGKTVIKIEQDQMTALGINSGDTVKVTWRKTTGAFCLPVESGFKQPNDSEIKYLNKSAILPQARMSDIVSNNVGNQGCGLVQVEIEKTNTTIASKVTLMSYDSEINAKTLDRKKLEGLIICKNNRLGWYDDQSLCFEITDVQPCDYSVIDKNTKLEFLEHIPQETIRKNHYPNLNQLRQVIPIVGQISAGFVTIMMPSIEIYDDGFRIYLYVNGKFDSSEFDPSRLSIFMPDTIVHDDLGNYYDVLCNGGGGSASENEFNYEWQLRGTSINQQAKELVIVIKEISFQDMFPFSSVAPEPPIMTEFRYSADTKLPSILIISGPWEFKIKL